MNRTPGADHVSQAGATHDCYCGFWVERGEGVRLLECGRRACDLVAVLECHDCIDGVGAPSRKLESRFRGCGVTIDRLLEALRHPIGAAGYVDYVLTPSWRTAILIEGRAYSADPEIPVDHNYNAIRTSTRKYIEYEGGFSELYDLTPVADPNELRNTYYSAEPRWAPRPALKARLDALSSCQPQDDPTTPEVERPCQRAEDGL
jgi:hypothetical protein